jgi:Cyclic nucleotide-binding domain
MATHTVSGPKPSVQSVLRMARGVTPHAMASRKGRSFDARAFLESAGFGKRAVRYAGGQVIFSQGDACDSVMYIRRGAVRLSVLSRAGREAIVGTVGAGEFLGEGALAGHPVRLTTAITAASRSIPRSQPLSCISSHRRIPTAGNPADRTQFPTTRRLVDTSITFCRAPSCCRVERHLRSLRLEAG